MSDPAISVSSPEEYRRRVRALMPYVRRSRRRLREQVRVSPALLRKVFTR